MKEKYKEFAERENLSIFMQPFWLDSVCEDGMEWDVFLYEKGDEIWGSFVYMVKKKYGLTIITMPKLTQILGSYIKYPKGQRYYKKLSWEKEIMNYFIDNLPKYSFFTMNFHYSFMNWLPFYWRGFEQTTRYSYVIENIAIKELEKNFETDIRRRRRKALNVGVEVYESEDIKKFYELNEMTFIRQGRDIPYSFEFIENLYQNCKLNNSCKIYFAKDKENNIIAGNFLIYDENTVYYLMGGIDPQYKDLGGMDIVQFESIKFALESGRKFDFEGSMIESIEKYFRSFGAIQKTYFNISKTNSKLLKMRNCIREFLK